MEITAYLRYSPRPDGDKSPSNDQQFGIICDWLKKQGIPTEGVQRFEDKAKSRDDMDRPGLWAAVKACQKGLFVSYALDRIGDVVAIETVMRLLNLQKAQLATVMEGLQENDPDSTLMRILRGGLALHQKQKNAAVTSYHMQQKQRSGQRMSRYAPFGTKLVYSHNQYDGVNIRKVYKLEPEPTELAIRELACELWKQGKSRPFILQMLRSGGVMFRGRPVDSRAVGLALKTVIKPDKKQKFTQIQESCHGN